MNIAFYVSGNATRLKRIIQDKRFKGIRSTIKLVYSDNISNDKVIGNLNDLNVKGIQYSQLGPIKENKNVQLSKLLLKEFNFYEVDYCFCFGDHILTNDLLKFYKNKIINFHPSLLPMFPGRLSIDQAIKANSFLLGNTAHFIDEGVDTGPIIMQSIVHRNIFDLDKDYDRILDVQIEMFYQIYSWIIEERIKVKNNLCTILNAGYSNISFYPKLDNIE